MLRICRDSGLVVVVIIGLVFTPGALEAAPTEEELRLRLVELGLRVELELDLVRFNTEAGRFDSDHSTRQAEIARGAIDLIEEQIRDLPDGAIARLMQKLKPVKATVANLIRAAELNLAPQIHGGAPISQKSLSRNKTAQGAPANDDCADAFTVSLGMYAGDSSEASNDGEAICGASVYSPDVWFRFVAPTSETVVIETFGSLFDTVLSVHPECPGTMANQIVCNDDASGLQSRVSITAIAGTEYLIRLSGVNGDAGAYSLNIASGGSIEGTVIRSGTGDPASCWVDVFDDNGFYLAHDYTDYDGIFRVDGLAAGDYYLATDGTPDVVDQLYDGHPCPGGGADGCDVTSGDPVPVTYGGITSGIDFVLDEGAKITGLVTDDVTGLPYQSAKIAVYNDQGYSVDTEYSNSEGVYTFSDLPDGTYYLAAWELGFVGQLYDGVTCPNGLGGPDGCSIFDGNPVVAGLNTTVTGIDFTLDSGARILGIVTDRTTGLPISSKPLRVYDSGANFLGGAYSRSDGSYEVRGLQDGTYFIEADGEYGHISQLHDGIDCPANSCPILTGTPVSSSSSSPAVGIDFDLLTKGIIAGRVTDQITSQGVQSIRVRLYNQSNYSVKYTYTDPSGMYSFHQIDPGTYFVTTEDSDFVDELYDNIPCLYACVPSSGNPVVVAGGQTTSGIDFSLLPMASIKGRVTDAVDGSPVRLGVLLFDEGGSYVDDYLTSTSTGEFEFSGLEAGTYFVLAGDDSPTPKHLEELYDNLPCWGGLPDSCNVLSGTPVQVAQATATTGIDFVLQPKGSIAGTVVDASTLTPLDYGTIYLRDTQSADAYSVSVDDGDFLFETILPGEYLAIADTSTHVDEVWDDQPCSGEYPADCDLSLGTPFTIGPSTVIDGIDFALDELPSVSGSIRSVVDGTGLTSVVVRLYSESGGSVRYSQTASDGSYQMTRLYAGRYFLATDEQHPGFVDQLFSGISCPLGPPTGCDPVSGTPIDVEVGSSASNIDLLLEPAGGIRGRVIDGATGLPLDGVLVEAWTDDGMVHAARRTDSSGSYHIQGLEPGTFYVVTDEYSATSIYLDQLFEGIPCPSGPPEGCDPTKGTPVTVDAGSSTRFVDFALDRRRSGIRGLVTDNSTGYPVSGIQIDLWDTATSIYEMGLITDATGTFVANVDPGSYAVATDNPLDFVNQVWEGIECPEGSAYNGDCDPFGGDLIVVQSGHLTDDVDFVLRPQVRIFVDGFESGTTDRWNTPVQ